jgi:hypothetical protein
MLVNSLDWQSRRNTVGRAVFGCTRVCGLNGDKSPVGQPA